MWQGAFAAALDDGAVSDAFLKMACPELDHPMGLAETTEATEHLRTALENSRVKHQFHVPCPGFQCTLRAFDWPPHSSRLARRSASRRLMTLRLIGGAGGATSPITSSSRSLVMQITQTSRSETGRLQPGPLLLADRSLSSTRRQVSMLREQNSPRIRLHLRQPALCSGVRFTALQGDAERERPTAADWMGMLAGPTAGSV